jgi:hypothetical protein
MISRERLRSSCIIMQDMLETRMNIYMIKLEIMEEKKKEKEIIMEIRAKKERIELKINLMRMNMMSMMERGDKEVYTEAHIRMLRIIEEENIEMLKMYGMMIDEARREERKIDVNNIDVQIMVIRREKEVKDEYINIVRRIKKMKITIISDKGRMEAKIRRVNLYKREIVKIRQKIDKLEMEDEKREEVQQIIECIREMINEVEELNEKTVNIVNMEELRMLRIETEIRRINREINNIKTLMTHEIKKRRIKLCEEFIRRLEEKMKEIEMFDDKIKINRIKDKLNKIIEKHKTEKEKIEQNEIIIKRKIEENRFLEALGVDERWKLSKIE